MYRVSDFARELKVSVNHIYEEIHAGRLSYLDLGNGDRPKIRIPASEAERWISARMVYRR